MATRKVTVKLTLAEIKALNDYLKDALGTKGRACNRALGKLKAMTQAAVEGNAPEVVHDQRLVEAVGNASVGLFGTVITRNEVAERIHENIIALADDLSDDQLRALELILLDLAEWHAGPAGK